MEPEALDLDDLDLEDLDPDALDVDAGPVPGRRPEPPEPERPAGRGWLRPAGRALVERRFVVTTMELMLTLL